jgi:hypothetical protein
VGGFLLAHIGPHRMLGKFPLALSKRLLADAFFIAACIKRVAYHLTKESDHEQER